MTGWRRWALAGLLASGCSEQPPSPTGAMMYQRYCASCHGIAGKGEPVVLAGRDRGAGRRQRNRVRHPTARPEAARRGAGPGCSGCASGWRPWAGASTPPPGRRAAFGSGRGSPSGTARDPGRAGRRPGAGAGRVPGPPRRPGRHRGRGRGRRRRRGRRGRRRRRGPTSCSWTSACPGRDGLEATRRIGADPALARGAGRDPHHVRARRVRVRGAAGRRQRLPGEGHRAGRAAARGPGGRRRRRAALPRRHPPTHRGVRHAAAASRDPSPTTSTSSPTASAR